MAIRLSEATKLSHAVAVQRVCIASVAFATCVAARFGHDSSIQANHVFDQLTHYSCRTSTALSASEQVTVYRAGQLIWGAPPAYAVPDQCFATAVNFGGDSLTSGGQHYLSGSDPTVLHSTVTPFPSPDAGLLLLVQSAVLLDTAQATLRVPNGPYWVYPYLISADGTNQGYLTLQGDDVVTFGAGTINGQAAWARLGPYRVLVQNGGMDFGSAGGAVRLLGRSCSNSRSERLRCTSTGCCGTPECDC